MRYWISCNKFTVLVKIDHRGTIIDAAPIVAKFIGQHIERLLYWSKKFGGLKTYMITQWSIYFDGGIREGNPGGVPTYGVSITDENGVILHSMSGVVLAKKQTNNVAEWEAVYYALVMAWANRGLCNVINIFGDSELVIKQLTGEYSVNAEHLKPIYNACCQIIYRLRDTCVVNFIWNRRDKNTYADELAGQAYDNYINSGGVNEQKKST